MRQGATARAPERPSRRAGWAAVALLAGLSAAVLLAGPAAGERLRYDRAAIGAGEVWRLVSCIFVHLGARHALLNGLGLLLLPLVCLQPLSAREWLRRVVFVTLGMSVGLYLGVPTLLSYVGLSGTLYGLFVLGLAENVRRRERLSLAVLVLLLAKMAWEMAAGPPAGEAALLGGRVIVESHVAGSAAALLYGLASGALRQRPREADAAPGPVSGP